MSKINYIILEFAFTRVLSALKKISDKETLESLDKISYILAEVRHAAVLVDSGVKLEDIKGRLFLALFNREGD